MENRTYVGEFVLTGLTKVPGLQDVLFFLFFMLYLTIILGNTTILLITLIEPRLHSPMYFFLGNLSCLDICYSTVTVPKMLASFLWEHQRISLIGCLSQLHFFHFLGSSEGLLLGVMAYDRYVAICNPLRYTIIMNKKAYIFLAMASWTTGFFHALMHTIMTSKLYFCGPNLIQHFFCDIKPLLRLACCSTVLNLRLLNIVTGLIIVLPFLLTLLSYIYIISFLFLKIKSKESRGKAFSTCASHLTVVTLFYTGAILTYIPPSSGESLEQEMMVTLMYTVVTPALNPLIYTLRNKEVKTAIKKAIGQKLLPSQQLRSASQALVSVPLQPEVRRLKTGHFQ
ncbi:olfactory receptor 12D1-like [Eublepharis macularius]|uniref:Olfactory receptor n=1 Tax=Eublepharis macularius TaxID=481883 RepID=A0AA97K4U2_EUBMA|nr:olfactory receptor 12D1-like [Eublepharis macularius]